MGRQSSSKAPNHTEICCETAGCDSDNATAARENDPSRATAAKVTTRRGSRIPASYLRPLKFFDTADV